MNNQDFNQINLNIQINIQNYSHAEVVGYNSEIKQEAKRFVNSIKPEISNLVSKLKSREIACYDIEDYLLSQIGKIDLSFLVTNNVCEENISEIKNDILRLIASAIMNSFLNSLFRNQKTVSNSGTNLFLN